MATNLQSVRRFVRFPVLFDRRGLRDAKKYETNFRDAIHEKIFRRRYFVQANVNELSKIRCGYCPLNQGNLASSTRRGAGFSWGWCTREPYCPLSSAVCNTTIPTLLLFEMTESACSPFCYVLHLSFVYKVYIGFLSRMRDWTVAVAQYSKFACSSTVYL